MNAITKPCPKCGGTMTFFPFFDDDDDQSEPGDPDFWECGTCGHREEER